jgi:hypothetical protein
MSYRRPVYARHVPGVTTLTEDNVILSEIRFRTEFSTYLFRWIPGCEAGKLTCVTGTHEGRSFTVATEDVRDLAWPGNVLRARRLFGAGVYRTSTIVWTDRPTPAPSLSLRWP